MSGYLEEAIVETAVLYIFDQLRFRYGVATVESYVVSSKFRKFETLDSREKSRIGGAAIVSRIACSWLSEKEEETVEVQLVSKVSLGC